uniref:Uncharacterized protein n=1 Tax=Triticum urartu TaxID=4572 RepID=A0A8R7UDB0_TRIUA
MLCSHVLMVMDILHLQEIPAKHILKRVDQGREGHTSQSSCSVPEG